jgi:UDP-2,3-diacylglucosamine pyrophosphatase LpxH
MKYKSVLCISDLHIPYHHPQAFDFLKALKAKIKPDLIVCGGDELDKHALSFHDSDPDLPSAGDELRQSKKYIWELKKIFPKMIILHSNHSSLIYRKALKHGMPRAYLRHYNEFLEVDKNWEWVDDLNVKLSDGSECYFTHGMSADGLKLAMQYGKNVCQFHFHSKFNIQYFSNPDNLVWSLQCGCLTKQSSLAFGYSKNFRLRFVIGTGAIINGQPMLYPMILDKNSNWIGKIV